MSKGKKRARSSGKNASRAARQEAPVTQKPTRRLSDLVLARMLDDHMQESISDIADAYQRLSRQLGARGMRFEEQIGGRAASARHLVQDRALDTVSSIVDWRLACYRRGVDTAPVVLIITEGLSLAGMTRRLRRNRYVIRAQIRASLSVWSLWKKRCDANTVRALFALIRTGDETSSAPTTVKA